MCLSNFIWHHMRKSQTQPASNSQMMSPKLAYNHSSLNIHFDGCSSIYVQKMPCKAKFHSHRLFNCHVKEEGLPVVYQNDLTAETGSIEMGDQRWLLAYIIPYICTLKLLWPDNEITCIRLNPPLKTLKSLLTGGNHMGIKLSRLSPKPKDC